MPININAHNNKNGSRNTNVQFRYDKNDEYLLPTSSVPNTVVKAKLIPTCFILTITYEETLNRRGH